MLQSKILRRKFVVFFFRTLHCISVLHMTTADLQILLEFFSEEINEPDANLDIFQLQRLSCSYYISQPSRRV